MGRSTRGLWRALSGLVVGLGLMAASAGDAHALDPKAGMGSYFRKCEFKLMVVGQGLARTEVPHSRFTAWARNRYRSTASRVVMREAKKCVSQMVQRNAAAAVPACRDNPAIHGTDMGWGISGYRLTRAKDAIKKTICSLPHRRVDGHDTRTYQGFRVYVRKVSGNGSCPNRNIIEPRELTIKCRSFLKDSDTLWNYMPKK